jgi:hypothetical protein
VLLVHDYITPSSAECGQEGVLVNTVNNESGRNRPEIVTYVGVTFFEFVRSEEQHEIPMTLCTTRNVFLPERHILLKSKQKVGDELYIYIYFCSIYNIVAIANKQVPTATN